MHTNPFTQGWNLIDGPTPSVVGALPTLPSPMPSGKFCLIFSPASNILSSVVYTTQGAQCVEIVTTGGRSSTTYLRKTDETLLGEIKWGAQPTVMVAGVVQPVAVNEWLRLSSTNNHYRYMYARGRQFTWERQSNMTSFCLRDSAQSRIASTVLDRAKNTVTLELTTDAMNYGLSEVCIVASMLLYSNRI